MDVQDYLDGADWLRNLARSADDASRPDLLFLADEFVATARKLGGQDRPAPVTITFPK